MFVNDKITCKLVKTPKNENQIMFNMFGALGMNMNDW